MIGSGIGNGISAHRRIVLAFALAWALLGFSGILSSAAQAADPTVFAAASLKNALDAAAAAWRAQTGQHVTIAYAASSTLAKQIASGAPADLFVSADLEWMDYLAQRDLIDPRTRLNLLGNELVLIAPKASPVQAAITPGFALAKLLGNGRLAMAEPTAVPAGRYARSALTSLGVWDSVANRIAAAENVRAALALVARGEAPLGIVYRTDAGAQSGVRIVGAFPAESHAPIVYPMALTKSAGPLATAFAAFLQSPAARAIFAEHGFTSPAPPQ